MIKVMLIDDEMLARMTVRSLIDWDAYGFAICCECSDGKQAMDRIGDVKPDIVITDIKMNYVNGDELVCWIYEQHPEIKVIVLSSYDDYHYVRDTLKHHAVDYIIKNNLTPEILLEVLNKALELGKKESRIVPVSEMNLHALRRQFILDLICGLYHGKTELIRQRMEELHISLNDTCYIPVLISMDHKAEYDSTRERFIVEFAVCNMLDEIICEQGNGMVAPLEHDLLILLLEAGAVSEKKNQELTDRFLRRASFCIRKFLHRTVSFYVGERARLEQIDVKYQELEKQRKNCFAENAGSYPEASYNEGRGLRRESEERLYEAVRTLNQTDADEVLEEIFGEITRENVSRAGCAEVFQSLLLVSQMICRKYGIAGEQIYGEEKNAMNQVTRLEKRSECFAWFREIYDRIFAVRRSQGSSEGWSVTVLKMMAYIQENFREQISLGVIAERLGRNSSYLSSVFKAEVGIGFTEYVNEKRLEYARELMDEGNQKLKEIIRRAGFYSYPYFFSLFKKKYGMTPNEYLKKKEERL